MIDFILICFVLGLIFGICHNFFYLPRQKKLHGKIEIVRGYLDIIDRAKLKDFQGIDSKADYLEAIYYLRENGVISDEKAQNLRKGYT